MAGAQRKFGGAGRIGKPRAGDLRTIYGRIEAEALDLGKGGKIVRSRSEPIHARGEQGGGGRAALSLSVRQRVGAARRLPPAIVKVVRKGQTGGGKDLRNQLDYLTRNGELNLTRADGSPVQGAEEVADLMRGWKIDFEATSWKHKTTHLLVSSPEGTDPDVVWRASERFANAMFGGGSGGEAWDYVKIAHDDTAFPHVHFVVNNMGLDTGEQFKVWPTHRINPQSLRSAWTEAARAEGLELDDTPRRARGLAPSRTRTPDRQRADDGEVSTHYLNRAAREVVAASEGRETGRARRFRHAFGEILEAEREEYRRTADALRESAVGSKWSEILLEDARTVDTFADRMEMPRTDGELVVAHLRHLASRPNVGMMEAFEGAALAMVRGGNGVGEVDALRDRPMQEEPPEPEEQSRPQRREDESLAVKARRLVSHVKNLFALERDPGKRIELQAKLGQERIRLSGVAERPDWAEEDNAGEAYRPLSEMRHRLGARVLAGEGDAETLPWADTMAGNAFERVGIDREAALHRVWYAGPVSKATAREWEAEEIAQVAKAFDVDAKQAAIYRNQVLEDARWPYATKLKQLGHEAEIMQQEQSEQLRLEQERREREEREKLEQSRGRGLSM